MLLSRSCLALLIVCSGRWASAGTPDASTASFRQGKLLDNKWVLSGVETRGDFDVDPDTSREDVTTDPTTGAKQAGIPLSLTIRVFAVDAAGVRPLRACMVDIQHANALGERPTGLDRWLMGHRVTNHDGSVHFETIIPGWGANSAPRIDVRLRTFSSQPDGVTTRTWNAPLFLSEASMEATTHVSPYANHAVRPVPLSEDEIYLSRCGDSACGSLFAAEDWLSSDGGHAVLNLFVDAATTL